MTYVADAAQVPEDLSGTTAIVVIGEESATHEPSWGTETLEFPQEQVDLVKALKDAGANVVEVVLMNRAYVIDVYKRQGEDYGVFTFPGTENWFGMCIDGFVVSNDSADVEAGLRWAYTMSTPEVQTEMCIRDRACTVRELPIRAWATTRRPIPSVSAPTSPPA